MEMSVSILQSFSLIKRPGVIMLLCQLFVLAWLLVLMMSQFLYGQTLQKEILTQSDENRTLDFRNQRLESQVSALRKGDWAVIEERARKDLGMVKEQETFFIFVD